MRRLRTTFVILMTNPGRPSAVIVGSRGFLYRKWLFMYIGSYSCSSPSAASRLLPGGKRGWEAGTHTLLQGPGTGPPNGGARGWWWVHTTQVRRMCAAQHAVAASQQMATQVAADLSARCKFRLVHPMPWGRHPFAPDPWAWPSHAHGFPPPSRPSEQPLFAQEGKSGLGARSKLLVP